MVDQGRRDFMRALPDRQAGSGPLHRALPGTLPGTLKERASRQMAVYTEIGDDELRAFIAAYDIGEALSCKGIAEGVENSNYLLATERGSFILTQLLITDGCDHPLSES